MIKFFNNLKEFKKEVLSLNLEIELDAIIDLDFTFFEIHDKYTLLNISDYDQINPKNILLISKKHILVYSNKNFNNYEKNFKNIIKKPYGETTIIILLLLKNILKNYSHEFQKIREGMNSLEFDPVIEKVEKFGRELRRLTDRFEELVQLIITLKERDIKEFNTSLIMFDYDILNAEARYWLERCRSHIYRIASLRTKSEMPSNRELNATITRLTVIMTFLSIIGIVVSVPGTIGAIFGIPALSNAYFEKHTYGLVLILVSSTLITIFLGYLDW